MFYRIAFGILLQVNWPTGNQARQFSHWGMRQKVVTDKEKITWTCVQAFSGTEGDAAQEAIKLSEEKVDNVVVVCTPTGGAATIRLELPKNWEEQMKEEEIVACIQREKNKTESSS